MFNKFFPGCFDGFGKGGLLFPLFFLSLLDDCDHGPGFFGPGCRPRRRPFCRGRRFF